MSAVFTLFGELKAETRSFQSELRAAEERLKSTERAIDQTEKRAQDLGKTNATTARSYEKLNEKLNEHKQRLSQAAEGYSKGTTSAKQLESTLKSTDRATEGLNSRLKDSNARLTDFANRAGSIVGPLKTVGSTLSSVGQQLSVSLTLPLLAAGAAFITSATSIDAMRNRLIAATGSVDGANAKMKELRALAQSSAGVFTQSAVEMYAFLRPMQVGEGTINTMIQAMGRLKLANEDLDAKRFTMNLTQLFTQNFERMDLKEAVGAFPRFGELMQKAFDLSGSDLTTVAAEMKKKLADGMSKEDFFSGIANAIQNDPSLSKLSDTVGIRFQKMMERIFIAFEPLGNAILSIVEPIAAAVTPMIQQMGEAFSQLSPFTQGVIIAFGAVAAAAGPVLVAIGAIISAIASIAGAVTALGGLSAIAPVIGAIAAGIALLTAASAAVYAAWVSNFGGIRDLVGQVGEFISSEWSRAMTEIASLTETVGAEIATFWNENGDDIMKAVTATSNSIKQAWQGIAEFWSENGDNIRQITSTVWGVVVDVVVGAVHLIGGVIKTVAAVVNGDWSKAWDGLKDIVSGAWEAVYGVIRGAQGIVLSAVKLLFNGVWALAGWISSSAYNLGYSLGMGLINGIKSMVSSVAEAAASLASTAYNAAKSALQIQSPSRLFMGLGKDTAQGYIDGIQAMKASVQSTLVAMLDISGIKINAKTDSAGIEMLTGLLNDLAKANSTSRESAAIIDLTAGKYAQLNAQVKERILAAARELDQIDLVKEGMEKIASFTQEFIGAFAPAQTNIEKITAALGDAGFKAALSKLDPYLANAIVQMAQFNAQLAETDRLANEAGVGVINRTANPGGSLGGDPNADTSDTQDVQLGVPPPPLKPWEHFWTTMRTRMDQFKSSLPSLKQVIGENLVSSIENVGQVFANAFAQWDGTAKGFFRSLAAGFKSLVSQIISELIRLMAIKAVMAIIGAVAGAAGGAAGGNTPVVTAHGTGVPLADGGPVSGPGTSTSDSIFARLSNGEFVMKAAAVRHWGVGIFERLNAMKLPTMAMASGGFVGSTPAFASGGSVSTTMSTSNNTNVFHIHVSGGGNPQKTVQSVKQGIREATNTMERERMRNK